MTTPTKAWPPVDAHWTEGAEAHAHPSHAIGACTAPTNEDVFSAQHAARSPTTCAMFRNVQVDKGLNNRDKFQDLSSHMHPGGFGGGGWGVCWGTCKAGPNSGHNARAQAKKVRL